MSKNTAGSKHILLVDDEMAIVNLTTIMLEHLGYTVTGFCNSTAAWKFLQSHSQSIDLLLTDQIMPQMTGEELAGKVHHLRPDLPIILCTGYSDYIDKEQAESIGIREIIIKPVLREDLAAAIGRILDND